MKFQVAGVRGEGEGGKQSCKAGGGEGEEGKIWEGQAGSEVQGGGAGWRCRSCREEVQGRVMGRRQQLLEELQFVVKEQPCVAIK